MQPSAWRYLPGHLRYAPVTTVAAKSTFCSDITPSSKQQRMGRGRLAPVVIFRNEDKTTGARRPRPIQLRLSLPPLPTFSCGIPDKIGNELAILSNLIIFAYDCSGIAEAVLIITFF